MTRRGIELLRGVEHTGVRNEQGECEEEEGDSDENEGREEDEGARGGRGVGRRVGKGKDGTEGELDYYVTGSVRLPLAQFLSSHVTRVDSFALTAFDVPPLRDRVRGHQHHLKDAGDGGSNKYESKREHGHGHADEDERRHATRDHEPDHRAKAGTSNTDKEPVVFAMRRYTTG